MSLSNLFMGFRAGGGSGQSPSVENSTALGSFSYTTESNQVTLGSDEVAEIRAFGVSWVRARPENFSYWVGDATQPSTVGSQCVFIGYDTGQHLSSGARNVGMGYQAMYANQAGSGNVAVGDFAISLSTSAEDCTAVGSRAMGQHAGGRCNTAIGKFISNNGSGDGLNTLVGDSPMRFATTGSDNSIFGYRAAEQTETGSSNTIFGTGAWLNKPHGNENVALGYSASWAISGVPHRNVAIGAYALSSLTDDGCVAAGNRALFALGGSTCTAIGATAGAVLATGAGAVFIGYQAGSGGAQATSSSNSMAIGTGGYTTGDNQIVVGNLATDATHLAGQVGIGIGYAPPDANMAVGAADEAGTACFEGQTALDNDIELAAVAIVASAEDPAEDGFGPALAFEGAEMGSLSIPLASIGASLTDSETNGRFVLSAYDAGVARDSVWVEQGFLHIGPTEPVATGGDEGLCLVFSGVGGFGIFCGAGAPSIEAAHGSLYLRTDGSGTTDRAYLNIDGASGWAAMVTAA